jgi:BRCA1-associated protein
MKDQTSANCQGCASRSELWICLICAHIGCNRFKNSHAVAHFEASKHRFSLDLRNQYVWDYEADGYAHRLLCRESGPLFFAESSNGHDDDEADITIAKLESLTAYYNEILSEQLHKQAEHFESKVREIKRSLSAKIEALQSGIEHISMEEEFLNQNYDVLSRHVHTLKKKSVSLQEQTFRKSERISFLQEHNSLILKDKFTSDSLLSSRRTEITGKYSPVLLYLDKEIESLEEKVNEVLSDFDAKS